MVGINDNMNEKFNLINWLVSNKDFLISLSSLILSIISLFKVHSAKKIIATVEAKINSNICKENVDKVLEKAKTMQTIFLKYNPKLQNNKGRSKQPLNNELPDYLVLLQEKKKISSIDETKFDDAINALNTFMRQLSTTQSSYIQTSSLIDDLISKNGDLISCLAKESQSKVSKS